MAFVCVALISTFFLIRIYVYVSSVSLENSFILWLVLVILLEYIFMKNVFAITLSALEQCLFLGLFWLQYLMWSTTKTQQKCSLLFQCKSSTLLNQVDLIIFLLKCLKSCKWIHLRLHVLQLKVQWSFEQRHSCPLALTADYNRVHKAKPAFCQ